MRRRILQLLVALAVLGAAGGARAFDLDEAQWGRDARNIVRLERVSQKLREDLRRFAAEHKAVEALTGQQNRWVDGVIDAYARIRAHLGAIRGRWEGAYVERGELAGEREARARGTLVFLGATAVTLENAAVMVDSFDNTLWEWRFNRATTGKHQTRIVGMFDDMWDFLLASGVRRSVEARLAWLQSDPSVLAGAAKGESTPAALLALVTGSTELERDRPETLVQRFEEQVARRLDELETWFSGAAVRLSRKLAVRIEGDPYSAEVGAQQLKKAHLPLRVRDEVLAILRPGDILLEKKRGSLVDMLIPGYFGHTALWLGTPEHLVESGVFDPARNRVSLDQALAHQGHLMEGRCVAEAVFTGVLLNDFAHALGETVVAVIRLRPSAVPAGKAYDEVLRQIVLQTLSHVDKDYDFWFNVNTPGRIVCSELVYQAYPDFVKWPTIAMVGRPTVSPDNIATLAGPTEDFPFEVVYFCEEGQTTQGLEAWRPFWKALKAEGSPFDPSAPEAASLKALVERLEP